MHTYPTPIKAAVIGLGIGTQHALAILENKECQLSRIVDYVEVKKEDFIASHSTAGIINSQFSDVLQDEEIKLVCIASFDDDHYEQVLSSLNANKNVFVEKPLCQTRKQLNNIYKTFLKKGCGIASNLVLRTSELFQHIKTLIQAGALGELYSFDGDYLYGRIHKITEGWRKDVDHYSVMAGGGIHMIDLMMWLTGQNPETVVSNINKIVTQNSSFRYHDFHTAVFTFKSGLLGRITANFGCMHRHQHVVRIFGTKGTFIYDDMGARIHWNREEDSNVQLLQYAAKPKKKGLLIHEYINQLKKNKNIEAAKREFDLMSVVLATEEAIHCDKPLRIEYLTC